MLLIGLLVGSVSTTLLNPLVGIVVLIGGFPIYWNLWRRWRWASEGAKGEFETAVLLARLPAEFTVFNDIPLNGFNVDHVIVGPSGVWAIETKSHAGFVDVSAFGVRVNGRLMYRDPCRQARRNAAEIGDLVESAIGVRYWVEALVCFPRANVSPLPAPGQSPVIGSEGLLTRIRSGSTRLSPPVCARIADVLCAIQGAARQPPPVRHVPDGTHAKEIASARPSR